MEITSTSYGVRVETKNRNILYKNASQNFSMIVWCVIMFLFGIEKDYSEKE